MPSFFTETSQQELRGNFIALYQPSLKAQKSFDRLMLFRNGII